MFSTTFRLSVEGSDYQNIIEKTQKELSSFLEVNVEDLGKYVSYEVDIEENKKGGSTYSYSAQVTARIKNV